MRSSSHAGLGPTGSPVLRRRALLAIWLLAGVFLLWKSAEVQLVQGADWRAEANRQHRAQGEVAAARGTILDRAGAPLALSHETFRIGIAPHELSDRANAAQVFMEILGLSEADARRVTQSERRWVQLPERYPPAAREALSQVRGVYVERELRRFHPHGELAPGILGAVIDGAGAGGLEQQYDDLLQGTPGSRMVARDSEGRPIPGESWLLQAPRSGGAVVTTLDRDLQEIAREALMDAIRETGARGGDLVVVDPSTGDLLALVSLDAEGRASLSAINSPYEPGSTLKPFLVASLLELGRLSLADSVDTGDGLLRQNGRTIRDVSRIGHVTYGEALSASSNVAFVQAAESLTEAEQYEGLRDFGFGVATGIQLPGEASGRLRAPREWSRLSRASLAMGYEIAATPLQMAMGYAALANGGVLMEPRIVRELRGPDGSSVETLEPRAVRRVVSEGTAATLTSALVDAVDEGTGSRARLSSFSVAGKSGTSRAPGPDGRYEVGAYYASFAGYFPAEAPQLVVFVKLDRPQGEYYGGATAAPVTRATMEAVLAARTSPLDRHALAAIARAQATHREEMAVEGEDLGPAPAPPSTAHLVAHNPVPSASSAPSGSAGAGGRAPSDPRDSRTGPALATGVPALMGQPARTALRRLHGLGVVVELEGRGRVLALDPPPGTPVMPGDTVRVTAGPPGVEP
ncbi:MAG: PASTA domain-containing protein [Gemmatimonadales bacterium]|nr:MAG: PASTA domain-containing protein [Gemmatimonadales bacterium]